jgi:DNA (cytosine-5)-methyltransferase 1
VSAGYDIDVSCRFAYERNNGGAKFNLKSVTDISTAELDRSFGSDAKYRILVGCAPCQPFSKYTQGQNTQKDAKWSLLHHFGRLAASGLPDIVSMENVPELRRHQIFDIFIKELTESGYYVSFSEVYCPDFGIPQKRRRLVLLASLHGKIDLIEPLPKNRCRTVREAIGSLPILQAGEVAEDRYHRSSKLSDINLKRIQASRPGGCWRDWPDELVARCHRSEMGKNYPSVYGRMVWDEPSPTITTQFFGYGNGRFGHPEQDRAISLREGALLQTFPPDYEFAPPDQPVVYSQVGKLIGNAVPVRLGEVVGESILKHLQTI